MDIPKKGQLWKHKNSGRKAWISTANDIRTYYRVSGAFTVDSAKTADFVAHYKNTGITDRLEIDGRTIAPTETPEQRQIRDEVDQRMNGHQMAQERQEGQEGRKDDSNKRRYSLLPRGAVNHVVDVLEFGSRKYADNNWQKVPDARVRYYDAAFRHIDAWFAGEHNDRETGLPHLAHAVCCLMFLMWFDDKEAEE